MFQGYLSIATQMFGATFWEGRFSFGEKWRKFWSFENHKVLHSYLIASTMVPISYMSLPGSYYYGNYLLYMVTW